jgi:hypothetical protein
MSIPVKPQGTYIFKSDPVYDVTKSLMKADQSTIQKNVRHIYSPQGSKTREDPIKQQRVDFEFVNESNAKMRFDTSCLNGEVYVSNAAGNAPAGTGVSLAPNSFLRTLEEATVFFNNNGTPVFKKTGAELQHHLISTILRLYPLETLNNRGDVLFTPIGSENYTFKKANSVEYDPAILTDRFGGPLPKLLDNSYLKLVGGGGVANLAAVNAADTFANTIASPYTREFDPIKKKRWENYVIGGANSHLHPIPVSIPFGVLFGISGLSSNLNKVTISFRLNANATNGNCEVLEKIGSADDGIMRVSRLFLTLDIYNPSITEVSTQTAEKAEGQTDLLTYFDTNYQEITPTGGENIATFVGQRDVQSVMLYQIAQGLTNVDATVTYSSPFEFFIGNHIAASNAAVDRSDHYYLETQGLPMDDIAIEYGSIMYPAERLKTTMATSAPGDAFNPLPAFNEYLKATGKGPILDYTTGTNFVSYDMFKKTMPFVLISPWSRNGVKRTQEPKTLTIKFRLNGTNITNRKISTVITTLKSISIAPSSIVSISS